MKNRIILIAFAVVVVAASLFALADQKPETAGVASPDFAGNVLVVYCGTEGQHTSHVVDKPQLQSIGNRIFLTGVGADTQRPEDWKAGMNIAVAWDAITSYHVFTQEQYAKWVAESSR